MNPYYPHLFEPLTIKRTTFRNRLFVAPHMMSHMDFNGRPDESMIDFFAEKARGGYAVVTLGDTPVDREHAVKLPEGRYFVADMIGCEVYDTNGAYCGRLTDVLETGANDVYVIKGEKRLMIPALKKLLKEVDVANKRIELYADVLAEVGLFED